MKFIVYLLTGTSMWTSCMGLAMAQQEMFLVCPHRAYCAGVQSNGAYVHGDPNLTAAFMKFERNVFDGLSPKEKTGRRMLSFQCFPDEWCIGTDNKGGVYAGSARPTAHSFGRRN